MLQVFGVLSAAIAAVPLPCFTESPAGAAATQNKSNNVCFGEYEVPGFSADPATTTEECAARCLNDSLCTNFVRGAGVPPAGWCQCR